MPSTNMRATRVGPQTGRMLQLEVLRREQISPHFVRVTFGGGDIAHFVPLGWDQWFRLALPIDGGDLQRVPDKLDTWSYLKLLTVAKSVRPLLRNYSVRAYRADGPELDVDFVVHGTTADGTAGPAATWAQTCVPGDRVAIIDEGAGFHLPDDVEVLRFVADETGVPAAANILASLPDGIRGDFVLEVPSAADEQALDTPPGVTVRWVTRGEAARVPGELALEVAMTLAAPAEPWYGVAVGEQSLASRMRRHWVAQGQQKERIMFCGYWRAPKA